ncbi:uncharacterized protein [Panulirus ornatus]|uniref:uncharacterized protein n=1 Tax=Panulirus ornatus TaxID=150431 RepID=UPI003A88B7B2
MTYSLRSTEEFIDIPMNKAPHGIAASLDVESLLTNAPVERTIDIILDYVYQHHVLPSLEMPRNISREMLRSCTMEAPFRCPQGKLYLQVDRITVEVLFAEAFMSYVETTALRPKSITPQIYYRYIDDILICLDNLNSLENLRNRLQETLD